MVLAPGQLQANLAAAVSRHLGCSAAVVDLHRLAGGAVAETWGFDALCGDKRYPLILRLARKEDPANPLGIDKVTEAQLQRAANQSGVPAPKVWLIFDQVEGIGTGYVMERIAGESLPSRILRDEQYAEARRRMTRQCGRILFQIHSLAQDRLPPLEDLPPPLQIQRYRAKYDSSGENRPVFELAFRWLDKRLPPTRAPTLVHGDFRNGNFIVGPEGIRAVLDWELAHWGDPMEDLGWLCVNSWRFGRIAKPVGGFGERAELFAAYEAAGGGPVDPQIVRFWEVFGSLKWGIICLEQVLAHLTGAARSVELAAIGRRVSETEIDLLNLIT
ncbi:MAG: phosphotransferase family protein [Desulfobacterales bacterium]|nr:MAG: phosphotransferase family protein [Desulfobacterales bacterium]